MEVKAVSGRISSLLLLLLLVHTALSDSGGSHPVHHPQAESISASSYPASSSSGKCGRSSASDVGKIQRLIKDLDYQLHVILASIPPAIQEARTAISAGTYDSNRDKFLTGIACFIGALSGTMGILYNKDPTTLSTGDKIYITAMNTWGYGYWGPYLLELDELEPGCGVEEFDKVVNEYSFITSLRQVYGSSYGAASSNPDDRPELRSYYVAEFGRKLKLALHCISSKAGGVEEAGTVVSLIDKYVSLGQERLELTQKLF